MLNTVGSLGIKTDGADRVQHRRLAGDKNDAWLMTGGTLYSVDLKTGKATSPASSKGVTGKLTDIAWID